MRPVRPGESITRGMQRFFPVLVNSFLVGLFTGVGFLLLIVPGFMAMAMYAVSVPACVVERLGPTSSMSRSTELTAGYRWPVFGALITALVAEVVVALAIEGATKRPQTVGLYLVLTLVWDAVTTSFSAVLAALIYHDLRVVKEGIDLEQIAALFD